MSTSPGKGAHAGLVSSLVRQGIMGRTSFAAAAMQKVDRAGYCPFGDPYEDAPQPIGHGQTISAPHMHAHALALLEPAISAAAKTKSTVRVLDVGSGSGYVTAALARLALVSGAHAVHVTGVEVIEELVEQAKLSVFTADPDLASSVEFKKGDGWKGCPSDAPYDAIHVGAAAEKFPLIISEQLALGGRMIVPVGSGWDQTLVKCDKAEDGLKCEPVTGVLFVPLVKGA